jgi:hypothetical protein
MNYKNDNPGTYKRNGFVPGKLKTKKEKANYKILLTFFSPLFSSS